MSEKCKIEICRLCLAKTATSFSLLGNNEISSMLEALTSLRISPSDDISTVMCLKCRLNLRLAFTIQQNMLKAEHRFRDLIFLPIKQECDLEYSPECVDTAPADVKPEEPQEATPQERTYGRKTKDPSANEPHVCDVCGKIKPSRSSLRQHKYSSHVKRKCPICAKEITSTNLSHHIQRHTTVQTVCELCGESVRKQDLSIHIANKHREIKHEKPEHPNEAGYACDACGEKFYQDCDLRKHIESTHFKLKETKLKLDKVKKQKVHACDACDLVTSSSSRLHRHKYSVHLRQKCSICHKLIAQDHLRIHMERHKNIFSNCEVCGASVKTINMKAHIRLNHNNLTYGCEYCDRVFKFREIMMHHQKKEHLNQADFVCGTCGKAFYKQRFLSKHIQSKHLKLRPHICQFCQVGFSTRYAMLTHQRRHTNETPYKCEVCGDVFRYKVTLKSHLKSKHDVEDELTCECKVCGKRFASEAALSSHGRIH